MLAPPAHVKLDVDVDDDVALRLFKIRTAYTARQRTSCERPHRTPLLLARL
jgi:hypothetical protein